MTNWLRDDIDKDGALKKLAKESIRNEDVQREIDALIKQLHAGNLSAGLGTKSLSGTDIFYLRGRNGSRLFVRKENDLFVIVGKSSKENEQKVMNKLRTLYG